jgi:hypothetical protein
MILTDFSHFDIEKLHFNLYFEIFELLFGLKVISQNQNMQIRIIFICIDIYVNDTRE